MMRNVILGVTLVFTGVLLFLTVFVLIDSGPSILTVPSVLVLAMFAFGIVGALKGPPER